MKKLLVLLVVGMGIFFSLICTRLLALYISPLTFVEFLEVEVVVVVVVVVVAVVVAWFMLLLLLLVLELRVLLLLLLLLLSPMELMLLMGLVQEFGSWELRKVVGFWLWWLDCCCWTICCGVVVVAIVATVGVNGVGSGELWRGSQFFFVIFVVSSIAPLLVISSVVSAAAFSSQQPFRYWVAIVACGWKNRFWNSPLFSSGVVQFSSAKVVVSAAVVAVTVVDDDGMVDNTTHGLVDGDWSPWKDLSLPSSASSSEKLSRLSMSGDVDDSTCWGGKSAWEER